jgi:hypothetical protein
LDVAHEAAASNPDAAYDVRIARDQLRAELAQVAACALLWLEEEMSHV